MALFDFQSHISLREPDSDINIYSIISVLLFIFGLSLLGSRFIFSPGITIDLPQASNIHFESTIGVLNLQQNGSIIFNDKILSLENLEQELRFFLEQKKNISQACLLIRVDRFALVESFIKISDAAKKAGFQKIQIACER